MTRLYFAFRLLRKRWNSRSTTFCFTLHTKGSSWCGPYSMDVLELVSWNTEEILSNSTSLSPTAPNKSFGSTSRIFSFLALYAKVVAYSLPLRRGKFLMDFNNSHSNHSKLHLQSVGYVCFAAI